MPYKSDKQSLNDPFFKRSAKLIPCQKEMVVYWHERGASSRAIAKMFNVSRRLIQFIIDPQKHKENLQRRQERGGSSVYHNKDKHNVAMKKHRKYKHKLLTKKDTSCDM